MRSLEVSSKYCLFSCLPFLWWLREDDTSLTCQKNNQVDEETSKEQKSITFTDQTYRSGHEVSKAISSNRVI